MQSTSALREKVNKRSVGMN